MKEQEHLEAAYASRFNKAAGPLAAAGRILGRMAKSPTARQFAREVPGRLGLAGATWLAQPHVEAGLAGRPGEAREGFTNTRLISALTAGALGPGGRGTGRKALGAAAWLGAPSMVRGLGERLGRRAGWGNAELPEEATVAERVGASMVGEPLVAGTTNAASLLGQLGTKRDIKQLLEQSLRGAAKDLMDQAGTTAKEVVKETGPEMFKNMASELGAVGVGSAAGYGVGALLSKFLTAPSPRSMDPSDPESVDMFYHRYNKYKRNRTAIKLLLGALGGSLALAGSRTLDNVREA